MNKEFDLNKRTFDFAVNVIVFLKNLSISKETDVIRYQLSKSATSVGANYEESQAAFSKEDFVYKLSVALKEVRESCYWLRIIKKAKIFSGAELDSLIEESEELKKIFGSIVSKSRNTSKIEKC